MMFGNLPRKCAALALAALISGWAVSAASQATISLTEAINTTLQNSPGVLIEKERVKQQEGALQIAGGQFDLMAFAGFSLGTDNLPSTSYQRRTQAENDALKEQVSQLIGQPSAPPSPLLSTYRDDTDSYYAGLSQQIRSGITFTPMVSTNSIQNNYDQKDLVNYSDVSLKVTIPLLKGLGVENTGAEEMAARENLAAGRLNYKQNVAQRLQDTITAYWRCLGAKETLDIAASTRSRADDLFKMVNDLIKGGELAPNSINEAQARLYGRDADLESFRLLLYQRRQNLGLSMGFSAERLAAVPLPQGPFPAPPSPVKLARMNADALVTLALERRGDYAGIKREVEAARILMKRAVNYLEPDLKLSLRGGYAGLSETSSVDRYYESLTDDMRGLNFLTSLVLELPVQNNSARGELVRRKAYLEQVRLRQTQLSQTISSEVRVAVETLRRAARELAWNEQAVDKYKLAAEVVKQRLRLGEGNVNDVVDVEDRYASSRIQLSAARQRYAEALVRLRLATGTLMEDQGEQLIIQPQVLVRLPSRN